LAQNNILMEFEARQQLRPELCQLVLGNRNGNKSGVDHLHQIIVEQILVGRRELYRRLTLLCELVTEPAQSLVWDGILVIVDLFTGQILEPG
jgi:hypothetical protein